MLWLQKGIVHILAVLLLAALLGVGATTAFTINLAHSSKLEGWLAESHLYDHVVDEALNRVQTDAPGAGSIAYSDSPVKIAANQAFSPAFIQHSANTFLDENYAWLQGKEAAPSFSIDLQTPKQNFAKLIGQLADSRLTKLPECSTTQLAGFQFPVDPLTVECRPPTIDPKTEAARVTQEISNSSALIKNPVITAQNIGENGKEPYYQQLSKAPKYYRLGVQLPWIFSGVILLTVLGILVVAPTRRRGLRRIAYMLLDAGVALIVLKYVLDTIVKLIDRHVSNSTLNRELRQPFTAVLDKAAAGIVHIGFYFGIGFVVMAVVLFGYLLITIKRAPKPVEVPTAAAPEPVEQAVEKVDESVEPTSAALPVKRQKPAMDIMMPRKKKPQPVTVTPEATKKPLKPRRRLVQ